MKFTLTILIAAFFTLSFSLYPLAFYSMKLHYRKYGQGPTLIILHGLYGSSDNWITIARKLESHFTVLLPDLRNHGASPHAESHSYADMVNDLDEFYADTQTKTAFLIGHSMGGKVAMQFAADNPEKVNRLMVVDIAPKNYLAGNSSFKHIRQHEMILELLKHSDPGNFHSRQELDQFFSSRIKEATVRHFLLKNIHRKHDGHFEWKMNARVLTESFRSIVSETDSGWFADRMPILAYPVTFVRGLNSEYIIDSDWPEIRKIYPEAKLVGISEAGHWLHAEQPELFIDAVLS